MKIQFKTTQSVVKSLLSAGALALFVALPLAGCNDHDSPETVTAAEKLATQGADTEPGMLDDAAAIKAGIEGLFGDRDSEPVDIETGEKIGDAFAKAGS